MRTKSSNKTENRAVKKVYPDLILPDGNTFGELLQQTFENDPPKKTMNQMGIAESSNESVEQRQKNKPK